MSWTPRNIRSFATLVAAGLFIPAWFAGWTLPWSVSFAALLAVYCRRRLTQALEQVEHLSRPRDAQKHILAELLAVVLQCVLITLPPQLIALTLIDPSAAGIDAAFYNNQMLPPPLHADQFSETARYVLVATATALLSFLCLTVLTGRVAWQAFAIYLHRSVMFPRTIDETRTWIATDAITNLCAALAIAIPLIYGLSLPQAVHTDLAPAGLALIAVTTAAFAPTELFLIIALLVGLKRLRTQETL